MNEEYLNQAANDYCHANLYDGKYCRQDVYEAFQDGMKHTMELPLADRLSESEKEKFIEYYQDCADRRKSCAEANDSLNAHRYNEAMLTLEAIFGSTLFTPTEQ